MKTWNQKKQIESHNGNRTCDSYFHNKDDFWDHFKYKLYKNNKKSRSIPR